MASADLNAVLSEYNGTNLQQLIKKYNLKNDDIAKLRQLNAKIDKELGVKDGAQLLPDSKEITLDDGTKVLAAQVRTVNQPKGGKVNVYITQDFQQYYQYVDANGKQQKITKTWDYISATGDNIEVAWNKLQDGHPWDALMTLMEGAEDPRGLNTGVAPAVGFAKGGGFIKSMKDFGKWLKQLKNIKSFKQFKSIVMSFIKTTKLPKGAKQLEDGTYYAQQRVSLSQGKWKATSLEKHVNSFEEAIPNKNPWGNTDFFREIRYNPVTKATQICETNGGRFATLKDISSDGKCVYTVLEPKSGGTIVYKGYNSNFQPISGVEQSITCLDKEGKVLAEFNGAQIKQGLSASVDYSQDHCAQRFLNVKVLEDGPPSADFSVGSFRDLIDLMKFVVRK